MLNTEEKRDTSARINEYLFRTIEQWMTTGLKKNGDGTYNCINPERNDSDPASMMVYPDGHAYDFAAKKRYSMIDLKALVSHADPKGIFKEVGLQLGVLQPRQGASAAGRPYSAPVIPIKKDFIPPKREPKAEPNIPARAATDKEIQRGKKMGDTFLEPTAVWPYKNKAGVIIAYAQRFDYFNAKGEKKKEFRPITWSSESSCWVYNKSGLNGSNPIYGAELLDSNLLAKVLIVEGEKTADAARMLFPEMIVLTFYGGTSSADKCDWSILQGREVLMWPDADQKTDASGSLLPAFEQSSMKAMISIARMLDGVARSSLIVCPPEGVRNKWDLADLNETQLTVVDLRQRMETAAHHFSHYLPPVSEPAPAENVQTPAAAPILEKWKPEQITTGIRTAFLEAVSRGTYGDEFPFAKDLFYYEPMSEANSKRRVPNFIAHLAQDGQVTIYPEAKWIDHFIKWYDPDGMKTNGSTPLLENVLVTLGKRLVPRLPRLPEPALFKWRGQPGNAWNILNFDISKDHLSHSGIEFDGSEANAMAILERIAPPWFEQLSRMNNRLAFMCYLGAIIDPTAHPQQYVWLYGKGNDGKSTIIQVLQSLFGPAAMKSEWPDNPNNFYTSRMESRRLLLLDDQEHGKVVRSGLWKTITGSDTITIEHKGQSPYVVPNQLLLVSASNSRPEGSADRADTRRLVLCECTTFPRNKVVKDYYTTLLAYTDPFFSLCWELWQTHKGSKGIVPVDQEITRHNTLEAFAAEEDFVAANFAIFDLERITAGLGGVCAKKQVPHTKNEDLRKLAEKARVSFKRVVDYLVNVRGFPAQLISYAKDEKHRVIFGVVPKPDARAFAGIQEQEFLPLPELTEPEPIAPASEDDAIEPAPIAAASSDEDMTEPALIAPGVGDSTETAPLEEMGMALIESDAHDSGQRLDRANFSELWEDGLLDAGHIRHPEEGINEEETGLIDDDD
ncbi:MAG: DUF5906 domain-containing protein [Pseudomonadota bacterium]